ncbi:hypothetical protein HDU76_006859 [Blyttiomyces sp. JEL0837]|nr:hypothetical protein HDU76_006859 [Blyttiomyces sp. JEL0837]
MQPGTGVQLRPGNDSRSSRDRFERNVYHDRGNGRESRADNRGGQNDFRRTSSNDSRNDSRQRWDNDPPPQEREVRPAFPNGPREFSFRNPSGSSPPSSALSRQEQQNDKAGRSPVPPPRHRAGAGYVPYDPRTRPLPDTASKPPTRDRDMDFLAFEDEVEASNYRSRSVRNEEAFDVLLDLPQPVWVDDPNKYSADLEKMFNQEVEDYIDYVSPTPAEHQMRELTLERLRFLVQNIWPGSEVHAFGSFRTKLYLPTSDVDIVILNPKLSLPKALYELSVKLKDHGITSHVDVIDGAKVPLVKYKDDLTNFPVDVSFNIHGGPEAVTIVEQFLADSRIGHGIRGLMYILKQFLLQRHLNEPFSGGLVSYGLLIMVASFLMMHPMIQTGLIKPQDNLGTLLLEFLELYGKHFNYNEIGIGVNLRHGSWYFRKENVRFARKTNMLTVLDPQDETNDVGGGSFSFHVVKSEFFRSYNRILCMLGTSYERQVNEHREIRHRRFNDDGISDEPRRPKTILGAILSFRKDLFEARMFIEDLADDVSNGRVETGLSREVWDRIEEAAHPPEFASRNLKRKRSQGTDRAEDDNNAAVDNERTEQSGRAPEVKQNGKEKADGFGVTDQAKRSKNESSKFLSEKSKIKKWSDEEDGALSDSDMEISDGSVVSVGPLTPPSKRTRR